MIVAKPRLAEYDRFLGRVALAPAQVRRPRISFEIMPPKMEEAKSDLWRVVCALAPLGPSFVSVTHGAGGVTRQGAFGTTLRLLAQTRLKPAPHLTCIGATREEIRDLICDYWIMGVRHVVAIRGDAPHALGAAVHSQKDSFANATELVHAITRIAAFDVTVACYPEKHPQSPSFDHDIDVLKAKIDAGATRAISQMFFDVETFLRFEDRVRKAGVFIPIVPGVMPVASLQGLARTARRCGASIPRWLVSRLEGFDDHPGARHLIAATLAAEMCEGLTRRGFEDLHLFTFNHADLVVTVSRLLGLQNQAAENDAVG
jgi:methylenetetrahydrofolate reductase (NADPH)